MEFQDDILGMDAKECSVVAEEPDEAASTVTSPGVISWGGQWSGRIRQRRWREATGRSGIAGRMERLSRCQGQPWRHGPLTRCRRKPLANHQITNQSEAVATR